jgi:hypothetical protein
MFCSPGPTYTPGYRDIDWSVGTYSSSTCISQIRVLDEEEFKKLDFPIDGKLYKLNTKTGELKELNIVPVYDTVRETVERKIIRKWEVRE